MGQDDRFAPFLFAIFIIDLALDIMTLKLGMKINSDEQLSILMYANDIILIAEAEDGLQNMLDTLKN